MNDKTTTATATNAQSQSEIEKQQADANAGPKTPVAKAPAPKTPPKAPAAKTAAKPAAKPAAEKAATPTKAAKPEPVLTQSLINLRFGIMVTLDLSGAEVFEGQNALLKTGLSNVVVTDAAGAQHTHNLFNPFRAVSAKTKRKDPTAARGLLRNALNAIYSIAAGMEATKTNYVGETAAVVKTMDLIAAGLRDRVSAAVGIPSDTILIDGTPTVEGAAPTLTLKLSDILSIEAWANTSAGVMDVAAGEGEVSNMTSQVFVNLRITAANLFSTAELDNGVLQIKNYLEASLEKFGNETDVALPFLFAFALPIESLSDRRYLDLLAFANDNDWELYSRAELSEAAQAGDVDWTPSDASADKKIMGTGSDMLVVTLLGQESEEAEASESDDSEAE